MSYGKPASPLSQEHSHGHDRHDDQVHGTWHPEHQRQGERANAFKATAKKLAVKIKDIYWTLGTFDGVVVFDAPDDETATALMFSLGSQGNVQTQTARAFNAKEIDGILAKMP